MIQLDGATVLLQWAAGGLAFLWVTTRHREVGIGYGWLLRGTYGLMALAAAGVGLRYDPVPVRDAAAVLTAVAAAVALALSVVRRRAGVAGEHARAGRVAARVGAGRPDAALTTDDAEAARGPEFPPIADVPAPVIAVIGLVAAGLAAGGDDALAVARTVVGALFLGAVTDAMLLGHWYLVQPGLGRAPLGELNGWVARIWPVEVALLLVPTGMFSVFSGAVDDGYGGMLGWFWGACAVATIALSFVTKAALKERSYSAVMAATGLLYLAILTAFGTDLVARAVLAGA